MTVIDPTTSQGQLRLLDELEHRGLRLQREPDGTYRIETRRYGSRTECQTPNGSWETIATFPDLASVADLEAAGP